MERGKLSRRRRPVITRSANPWRSNGLSGLNGTAREPASSFLPKYSPDLNPIEQVFAKVKTLLRNARAKLRSHLRRCGKILAQYPPAECATYLKNAGYA
jgi:transposase